MKLGKDAIEEPGDAALPRGLARSDIVRQAVLARLRSQPAEGEVPLGQRFRRFCGVVHSGIPDLGTNHRKYLADWGRDDR